MRCAVLGDPIDHSLSPALHRAAYDVLGLDWTYDAVRVPSGGLADFLGGLDDQWRGLSLTMPLKREAMPLLDSADAWAELAGAANTLLLEEVSTSLERRVTGLNTDVPGAVAALREAGVASVDTAVVLGGGATATSVLLALAELGCSRAVVAVREPSRAADTLVAVARHPRAPALETVALAELATVGPVDVVVSTIPAAAQTAEIVETLAEVPVVFDVLYDPWPTPLAARAAADRRTLIGGLDLLVRQAVDQVRAMTGRDDVPVAAMRAAGEARLAERRP